MKRTIITVMACCVAALVASTVHAGRYDRDYTSQHLSSYTITTVDSGKIEVEAELAQEFGSGAYRISSDIYEFKASNTKRGSYVPPRLFARKVASCTKSGKTLRCALSMTVPAEGALECDDLHQLNIDDDGDGDWDRIVFARDAAGRQLVDRCYSVGLWIQDYLTKEKRKVQGISFSVSVPLHDGFTLDIYRMPAADDAAEPPADEETDDETADDSADEDTADVDDEGDDGTPSEVDTDGDGIVDDADNCVDVPNGECELDEEAALSAIFSTEGPYCIYDDAGEAIGGNQSDIDLDGIGDACDDDFVADEEIDPSGSAQLSDGGGCALMPTGGTSGAGVSALLFALFLAASVARRKRV